MTNEAFFSLSPATTNERARSESERTKNYAAASAWKEQERETDMSGGGRRDEGKGRYNSQGVKKIMRRR